MTLLFRSNSCGHRPDFNNPPPSPPTTTSSSIYQTEKQHEPTSDEDGNEILDDDFNPYNQRIPDCDGGGSEDDKFTNRDDENRVKMKRDVRQQQTSQDTQSPILEMVLAALRKSLVTCSVETDDVITATSTMDIGWPTDVRHVSHVTFDRFNGFLGLPVELEPEVPRTVPSASASVFGVSPQSMQCSIDERGNSVPTILPLMQMHLYAEGGLQAEGIFRINAENGQEEWVRSQLNRGYLPQGIDVHCLAGQIKAWFRELPSGVLDSLTPDQVMHCNTEDQCSQLVKHLPPTEFALLDWAINLMADVVQNEHHNKMNARNIAMVFAPNMTQMADPLTALIHAVQVMNLLKTLITKTLREREEQKNISITTSDQNKSHLNNSISSNTKPNLDSSMTQEDTDRKGTVAKDIDCLPCCGSQQTNYRDLFRTSTLEDRIEFNYKIQDWKSNSERRYCSDMRQLYNGSFSSRSSPMMEASLDDDLGSNGSGNGSRGEGMLERLRSLKRGGAKKVYGGGQTNDHPVFQLSKGSKMDGGFGIVNT